jgi:CRP-like cAMP-binding protein
MSLMNELTVAGQHICYSKGEHIFQCGDNDTNIYIIKSGIAKAYYVTAEGKEFIKSFIAEGSMIACMQAFLEGKESNFSLVALEDCDVLRISKAIFMKFMENTSYVSEINTFLVNLALKKEQREFDFLCLSATERYQNFRTANPTMESRVTQVDIARYLGITPVALSRIRRDLNGTDVKLRH